MEGNGIRGGGRQPSSGLTAEMRDDMNTAPESRTNQVLNLIWEIRLMNETVESCFQVRIRGPDILLCKIP